MFALIGVALVIVGFALRINPLLVVTVAGIATAAIAGIGPVEILDAFGTGFAGSRSVTTFVIVLPVIGLIERYGLQDQAKHLIGKLSKLTTGRLLAAYLFIRQVTAAVGLNSIGGPAQTVRPLVYPMAEGAAVQKYGDLPEKMTEKIKGHAAGADNVGVFFGEDIFVAIGSILLITSFVDTTYNLTLEPLALALWAIPTGVAALLIHGTRLLLLDRQLSRMAFLPAPPKGLARVDE
ncbi:DUF969 domain-containing protein [Pseudonocardia xinjiangensis]|uniref:DUF969 domain-containing protein n=1 Tax=Pseudonocardia xinjiangensis TaxID=75289 RepID=A0ABX1R8B4_9PSEU|nr:DUF969 domain-containing protein [Pseudonocardia xinjiangensis]NMH75694.1 DUF969 domain-containing protein [Pseudonocardia xinjiangensis]